MTELTRRSALLAGASATAGAGIFLADPRAHAADSRSNALQAGSSADELFMYNDTPAAGTLIASVAAENGTDQFGNSYLAGETTYAPDGGTFVACQNNGGAITFCTATTEAGPWTPFAQVGQATAGQMALIAPGTGILQFGAGVSAGIVVVGPTGDQTGKQDSANIKQAFTLSPYVVLLPGTFYLSGPIIMSQPRQVLSGSGPATVLEDASPFSGSALITPSASSQRVTNLGFVTKAVSFIDFADNMMNYFECDHVQGNGGSYSNLTAPDIFINSNVHQSSFHDLVIMQYNPDARIWFMGSGTGMGTVEFRDCKFGAAVGSAGNRTVSAFDITLATDVNIDLIRFVNVLCDNMQGPPPGNNIDNTQFFFSIANTKVPTTTDPTEAINDRIEFDHVVGNQMLGGFIRIQSTWTISLQHVSVGNMFAIGGKDLSNGSGNAIVRIERHSGNPRPSGAVRIVNYSREGTTSLGDNTDPSDISLSNDTAQVYIESPNVIAPGKVPTPAPLQIGLGDPPSAANVLIMNPPSNAAILGGNTGATTGTIIIGNGAITIGGGRIT